MQLLLHDGHLAGSKLQLLQPHHIALTHVVDLSPPATQQCLKGEDELQVGGGGDIVVAPQDSIVAVRQHANTLMKVLAQRHTETSHLLTHVHIL